MKATMGCTTEAYSVCSTLQRYAAVPPVPVVEEMLGLGGGAFVGPLENDRHGDDFLTE